jgi:phosphate transport system substrate-binding protein
MKTSLLIQVSAAIFTAAVSLPAIADDTIIRVDGSSTVFPITEAVAEEFQVANAGHRVTVGLSGTGGGFKKLCRGEVDIAGASRPISAEEMGACKTAGIAYFELPIAFDAVTVVVSAQNTTIQSLTLAQLKTMWEPAAQANITKWNQVDASLGDKEIRLFGPGADSGTFDYFTEAVVGKAKASRGDYSASEDDNVLVQGVSADVNALGYFGMAYYVANQDKLRAVAIDAGQGVVTPSRDTVVAGTYQPLSRPIFIYVSQKSLERAEVKSFVDYYLSEGKTFVEEVQYVPLPDSAYEADRQRLAQNKAGSVFGGKNEVGVKIDDVMAREPSLDPKSGS